MGIAMIKIRSDFALSFLVGCLCFVIVTVLGFCVEDLFAECAAGLFETISSAAAIAAFLAGTVGFHVFGVKKGWFSPVFPGRDKK